jgi:hypothetical protein
MFEWDVRLLCKCSTGAAIFCYLVGYIRVSVYITHSINISPKTSFKMFLMTKLLDNIIINGYRRLCRVIKFFNIVERRVRLLCIS